MAVAACCCAGLVQTPALGWLRLGALGSALDRVAQVLTGRALNGTRTGTLPTVTLMGAGSDRRLRIFWRQRKAATLSGLIDTPQFTSSLSGLWQDGGQSRRVRSIDGVRKQIAAEDTVAVGGSVRSCARVKVELYVTALPGAAGTKRLV